MGLNKTSKVGAPSVGMVQTRINFKVGPPTHPPALIAEVCAALRFSLRWDPRLVSGNVPGAHIYLSSDNRNISTVCYCDSSL